VRIVYLNPSGQLGGAETSLLAILASIRAAVPSWELWLVIGEDGPLAGEARKLGVHVVLARFPGGLARLGDANASRWAMLARIAAASAAALKYKRHLARVLGSINPDLIHTNGFKMHLLGAWTRPQGTPLLWHIHDYVSTRPLMRYLLRAFQKPCTAAIANSNSVANDLRTVLPGLPVVPIYNAIDLNRFSPVGPKLDLDAAAKLPPVSEGTIRVGLVATFARWKGHKVFLRALAQLPSSIPVRGYIIGAPIYQTIGSQWSIEELEQEVQRLGLAGKVGFTGFLPDPPAAMRSLDIVVHASSQPEPFGMVIIEAMACGAAVIASRAGGAAELFVDGETALAHQPADVAALAKQIDRLVRDKALRQRLAKSGRASAERLFDAKRLAQQLALLYRESATPSTESPAPSVEIQSGVALQSPQRRVSE
jgi:glycosyltransferase involved in cell wall biosynthesis